MRNLWISMALLAAACAPPTENASEPANEAEAETNVGAVPADPAPAREAPPPPADKAAPKEAPAPAAGEPYTARGQEPGWALKIDKGRIDYQGNYGEKLINVARPEPQ